MKLFGKRRYGFAKLAVVDAAILINNGGAVLKRQRTLAQKLFESHEFVGLAGLDFGQTGVGRGRLASRFCLNETDEVFDAIQISREHFVVGNCNTVLLFEKCSEFEDTH